MVYRAEESPSGVRRSFYRLIIWILLTWTIISFPLRVAGEHSRCERCQDPGYACKRDRTMSHAEFVWRRALLVAAMQPAGIEDCRSSLWNQLGGKSHRQPRRLRHARATGSTQLGHFFDCLCVCAPLTAVQPRQQKYRAAPLGPRRVIIPVAARTAGFR